MSSQMRHEALIFQNRNQQHSDEASDVIKKKRRRITCSMQNACFSRIESSENWLIDNSCTNHMTHNKDLFRKVNGASSLKVRLEMTTILL